MSNVLEERNRTCATLTHWEFLNWLLKLRETKKFLAWHEYEVIIIVSESWKCVSFSQNPQKPEFFSKNTEIRVALKISSKSFSKLMSLKRTEFTTFFFTFFWFIFALQPPYCIVYFQSDARIIFSRKFWLGMKNYFSLTKSLDFWCNFL